MFYQNIAPMQRLIISDDHSMLAMMLKIWFQQIAPDVEVVAITTSGRATIAAVRQHKPDVLLQDMMLGDMTGLEIIRQLREEFAHLRIFAMSARPALAKLALESGANGCMLKEDHPHVIRQALDWDVQQGTWTSPLLQEKLVIAANELAKYHFTAGEVSALRLAHLPNTEIAATLGLTEGSVRNIFTTIYQKTGMKARADLTQWTQNVLLMSYTQNV
jgi:DNA-binding NarL/FixJ family response regulator